MRKNILFLVLALLCLNFNSSAQSKAPDSLSYKIGDQLPESFWQQEHLVYREGKAIKQNLSAHKGKLIILDFWATWCSACLAGFPKMAKLEKQFDDQLSVVKVTDETFEKMTSFVKGPAGKSIKAATGKSFSTIMLDKRLAAMFPHKLIPYLVYIGKDGKVLGFSDAEDLNGEVIRQMLVGVRSASLNRKDHDLNLPIFLDESHAKILSYAILYKGNISGLGGGNFLRQKDGNVYGLAVTNLPMDWLYRTAVMKLNPWYQDSQFLVEVANPAAFTAYNLNDANPDKQSQLYTLDIRVPPERKDSLYTDMLRVLNDNSGYFGKQEKRVLKCLVYPELQREMVFLPACEPSGIQEKFRFSGKTSKG
jgi:thiol-disulfide isomerase/thioredoxin